MKKIGDSGDWYGKRWRKKPLVRPRELRLIGFDYAVKLEKAICARDGSDLDYVAGSSRIYLQSQLINFL